MVTFIEWVAGQDIHISIRTSHGNISRGKCGSINRLIESYGERSNGRRYEHIRALGRNLRTKGVHIIDGEVVEGHDIVRRISHVREAQIDIAIEHYPGGGERLSQIVGGMKVAPGRQAAPDVGAHLSPRGSIVAYKQCGII